MNVEKLLAHQFKDVVQSYDVCDTLLYALSVGAGADPVDPIEQRFVFERNLVALPTQAVVLCHPGPWGSDPGFEIDGPRILYAQQHTKLYRPLPTSGRLRGREKIVALVDKGAAKGLLMTMRREIVDDPTGEPIATLDATAMCRGDGGCGAALGEIAPPHIVPDRKPDRCKDISTLPQQALLYRLNGDMNPIHADPDLARRIGFDRPILHGLCSYAIAGRALIEQWCDGDATQLRSLGVRFTAPLYPGETLAVESWRDGATLSFRALAKDRGVKVLDNGVAEVGWK